MSNHFRWQSSFLRDYKTYCKGDIVTCFPIVDANKAFPPFVDTPVYLLDNGKGVLKLKDFQKKALNGEPAVPVGTISDALVAEWFAVILGQLTFVRPVPAYEEEIPAEESSDYPSIEGRRLLF